MAITAAQLMVTVGADVRGAEQGLATVSDRLGRFGQQAAITGGILSAGLTTPLVGVAKGALTTAISYEGALNMMQAVSGATAQQMRRVSERALALGADMTLPATSAADAASAMVELAKAGLSVNDTLAAAQGVLQLSAAGKISEAQAATIAATALNAFSLEGSEATRIADLLAAAASTSAGEVTDMADSLQMSAAVFAAADIPIETLVASIGQMANAGILGSDAGTSLRTMLLRLTAPTDKSAEEMARLGINIFDAQGAMLPFRDVIDRFQGALGGLTQEQRSQSLATIFGTDAVRAANIVLMEGAAAHDEMLTAVTAQGAAGELAGARMRGLGGALQGLQSQVETLLLTTATPFLATLEGWARVIADEVVPALMGLDPTFINMALAVGAVLAAMGPLVLIAGVLAKALAILLSPIGLIMVGMVALAAAWVTNWGGIREVTQEVFGRISTLVRQHWPAVEATITSVVETVRSVVTSALGFVRRFWAENGDRILESALYVWGVIQRFIDLAVHNVQGIVTSVMTTVSAFWAENGTEIMEAARLVWLRIEQITTFFINLVRGLWEQHGDTILSLVQTAWSIIRTVIDTALNIILGIVRLVVNLIRGDWQGAWDAIKGIAESVWNGIVGIITGVMDALGLDIGGWLDSLSKNWGLVWAGVQSTTERIWGSITGAIRGAVNSIIGFINLLASAWNNLEFRIPGFNVTLPSVNVPRVGRVGGGQLGWGGIHVGTPDIPLIPMLGAGGLVTRPTLSLLGESGPEAVLPLRDNTLDLLADRIVAAIAGKPTYTINAQYRYQDERTLRDDLRLIQMLGATT